jgi:hypothetical protein
MGLIELRGRRLAMGGCGEEEGEQDKRWSLHGRATLIRFQALNTRTGMETSFSLGRL